MHARWLRVMAALLLLTVPAMAQANVGTPLMMATFLHLTIGNLLIGVLEGSLLRWLFGVSWWRGITVMVLANYFSMCLGYAFWVMPTDLHLENVWMAIRWQIFATFAATLLLEFPFVAFAVRKTEGWLRNAVVGSLIVQTVSYTLLFTWYSLASFTTIHTQNTIVPVASMDTPEGVAVYFIGAEDGHVYTVSLKNPTPRMVFELGSEGRDDRLIVRTPPGAGEGAELVARLETEDRRNPRYVMLMETLDPAAVAIEEPRREMGDGPPEWEGTNFTARRPANILGSVNDSTLTFRAGFWGAEGLNVSNSETGERWSVAMETPMANWPVRNVTHLPGDLALFQLGRRQICLYDPAKRQVALLARGRGPVAMFEKE